LHIPSLIEKKRDGKSLTELEITKLVKGFTSGEIPRYQMSAFAMAVYFQGMNSDETTALTRAMLESGKSLDFPGKGKRMAVDKHSTGGIGDKVSLVLAPLLACDTNLIVPMISGRGLGITGGTLDKLESIPGFNVNLSREHALRQIEAIGVVMMGQTVDIAPADKKLYELRDVTATVASEPLIVASIMSKKLAESLDKLVLDVKFGSGAFMKTEPQARSLGEAMQSVGKLMGVETHVKYNPMDQPLGQTVGNALEVREAIAVLKGEGHTDLVDITLDLAATLSSKPRQKLRQWLCEGKAYEKFLEIVDYQGGESGQLERLAEVHKASVQRELRAERSGVVTSVDAQRAGQVTLELGCGRQQAEDRIDFSAGLSGIIKIGDTVQAGDTLLTIHAPDDTSADTACRQMSTAIRIE
jgi:pyrimidine-nucleoside phosphorylase